MRSGANKKKALYVFIHEMVAYVYEYEKEHLFDTPDVEKKEKEKKENHPSFSNLQRKRLSLLSNAKYKQAEKLSTASLTGAAHVVTKVRS